MRLVGKTILLRDISMRDSKFLFSIRKQNYVSRYLNNPPNNVHLQSIWTKKNIASQKTKDFIILDKKNRKIGTIALNEINLKKRNAEWGRWICLGNSYQSIESFILLSKYSFINLKLRNIYSLTNQKNNKVIKFQIRAGGKYCGIIKNKYLIKGKKTHAVKYIYNKKSYQRLEKKFTRIYKS